MESTEPLAAQPAPDHKSISFQGKGSEYFGILIVNFLLTVLTLGIYYPWAKAAKMKYIYQETEFEGSRFTFHGTGFEMFKGMIKAVGVLFLLFGIAVSMVLMGKEYVPFAVFGMYAIIFLLLIPVALVGTLKYRLSRTSWRGIHGGYRGTVKSMLKVYLAGAVLTLVTLGLYGFWFWMDIYKEIFTNTRLGNIKFSFRGRGDEYLRMNVMGYILTFATLGIYYFWWKARVHNYFFNSIVIHQDDSEAGFESAMTGGAMFELKFVNLLLLVFTLGLAFPWIFIRTVKTYASRLKMVGGIDLDAIVQTEENYSDATGEGIIDGLDIQLI